MVFVVAQKCGGSPIWKTANREFSCAIMRKEKYIQIGKQRNKEYPRAQFWAVCCSYQAKSGIVLNSLNYWFLSLFLSLNIKETKMLRFETTYQKTLHLN
jgi:hypothetical protein